MLKIKVFNHLTCMSMHITISILAARFIKRSNQDCFHFSRLVYNALNKNFGNLVISYHA